MNQWKIGPRRGVCTACERDFEDGERHISTLRVTSEGLERTEVCEACREGADEPGEDVFWWFTRHSVDRKKTVQLDLESLERLFLELEGREEPQLRELRYVLCLLLMRKRRVKVEKVERDEEGESFVVRRPRREQRYKVYVFDFDAQRMAELRSQLQAIFDGFESEDGLAVAALGEGADPPSDGAPERDSGSPVDEVG